MIALDHWRLRFSALLLAFGLGACGEPPPPAKQALGAPLDVAAQLVRGRAVYNFRCYYCHGYSGDAKTLAATFLTPPPADFKSATAQTLPPERILAAVSDGRPGTGMSAFRTVISTADLAAVAAFVFDEFVLKKAPNTRYHTAENGWPNHERYRDAYPFALHEVALTTLVESLPPEQQRGRALYLGSCVSCHDRGKPVTDPTIWDSRPLSYPRNNYDHKAPEVDAATSATPYRLHDVAPILRRATAPQKRGEKLFQENCAFCHAADGTGKNWIGAFMQPHPRNLTDAAFMGAINRAHLATVIRNGLKDTSMPAWGAVLSGRQISDVIAYIDTAFHPVRP